CQSTLEVVARFLALLELYREGLVGFDQVQPLGELTVRWVGGDDVGELQIDEYVGATTDRPTADASPDPKGTTKPDPVAAAAGTPAAAPRGAAKESHGDAADEPVLSDGPA